MLLSASGTGMTMLSRFSPYTCCAEMARWRWCSCRDTDRRETIQIVYRVTVMSELNTTLHKCFITLQLHTAVSATLICTRLMDLATSDRAFRDQRAGGAGC